MRRTLPLFLLALLFALAAVFVQERSPDERLESAEQQLQARIDTAYIALSAQAGRWAHRSLTESTEALWRNVRDQRDEDREFRIQRDDSLLLWTGRAPIEEHTLDTIRAMHLVLPDGIYLHVSGRTDAIRVHALQRVWYNPPFENRYLKKAFAPRFTVEDGIEAALGAGMGPVLRDPDGAVMFRLHWHDDVAPPSERMFWKLLLVFAAIVFALAALWSMLIRSASKGKAAIVFAIVIIGVRALGLMLGPWPLLNSFTLFDPSLFAASFELPSLGDLLVDVALLVSICAFAWRAMRDALSPKNALLAAIGSLALLLAFAAWINNTIIALVRDSQLSLDLFHVLGFDAHSVIALFAIAFMLSSWLLLADALVRWCAMELRFRTLIILIVAATVLMLVVDQVVGVYDTILVLWPGALLMLIVLLDRDRPRFSYGLLLVVGVSLYTVHMLDRQALKRMEGDRITLAETASTREDPVIELLFHEAENDILGDADPRALLRDTALVTPTVLDQRIRHIFFNGHWENYDVRLFLFSASGTLRGSTSPDAPPSRERLRERFEQGVPVNGDLALRNVHRPTENALYIGVIGPRDGVTSGELYVELLPRALPEGIGFPELLLAGDRSTDQRLDRFVRGRYERGILIESSGAYPFPGRWQRAVPKDGLQYVDGRYDLLATSDAKGTFSVIGMAIPSLLDHATSFSYMFVFYSLLAVLFLIARALIAHRGFPAFGLGRKLRAGILLFAGLALLLFAFGTQRVLRSHYTQHTDELLDERSRSALAALREHLHLETSITPNMLRDLDHWVDNASTVLLTDLSFYSPSGELQATSREQVFNSGLLGTRMDPAAYRAMAINGSSAFAQQERIGSAVFRTAYRPFRNDRGQVLGYLALPYFARQGEVEQERAAGYVAIVNLFVLLFVLSVIAAALIANWTTRPLQLLKRGLERIQLGERNEPIVYQGNDELGELVRVYNRKVEELRESAEKLARSERESAWREMAKQVAHEIKNPLTPMKLSIQQFQRSWDPQAPDAKEKLDKLSTGIVQQIDALSGVATAFSQFAQMPSAQPVDLDLREVAEAAVSLFVSEQNAGVNLIAPLSLHVHADREQLLRVLNNLIKNALQAVPEDRRALVEVTLRSEGDEAIIEVRDNGSGIPEEVRERIFTPSFTTKSSGMGLGLAMVKRMVEQAGGCVWYSTRIDQGTSFFVALPLVKEPRQ